MKKRDEIDNIESCLNRAEEDEPLFVLRANDELAPAIVLEWAERYREQKLEAQGGLTDEQRAKYDEAKMIAMNMVSWWHERHANRSAVGGET